MKLGELLEEVTERAQDVWSRLDLVEEERGPAGNDVDLEMGFEVAKNGLRRSGAKVVAHLGIALEVYLYQILEGALGEHPDQAGLSDLPGSSNDEGLAPGPLLPLGEVGQSPPVHFRATHDILWGDFIKSNDILQGYYICK